MVRLIWFVGLISATEKVNSQSVINSQIHTNWFLVYTKQRAESVALHNLLAQNYEAWLPLIKQIVRGRKKRTDGELYVMEPMFPR
jgi:hypothetical protein